jgi:hypothetical protein
MFPKTRPNSLILCLGVPRLDPANTRLLRHHGTGLDVSSDSRLIVAEQVRIFLVEHAVDFQDVAVAGGSLKFVARAVEAEDERLFGGEDWVAGGFVFFFFAFFVVCSVSEGGFRAVVALRPAVGAFFLGRLVGAVWSAVAVVIAIIVAVGVMWHSWSVHSWSRIRTSSNIRSLVAID